MVKIAKTLIQTMKIGHLMFNKNTLKNTLETLIDRPEKIKEFKQKSRKWVVQYHDLNSVTNTLYDYYKVLGVL